MNDVVCCGCERQKVDLAVLGQSSLPCANMMCSLLFVHIYRLSFEGGKEGGLASAIALLQTQVEAAVKAGCQVCVSLFACVCLLVCMCC